MAKRNTRVTPMIFNMYKQQCDNIVVLVKLNSQWVSAKPLLMVTPVYYHWGYFSFTLTNIYALNASSSSRPTTGVVWPKCDWNNPRASRTSTGLCPSTPNYSRYVTWWKFCLIVEMRHSWNCFIFRTGFPLLVRRWHIYIWYHSSTKIRLLETKLYSCKWLSW